MSIMKNNLLVLGIGMIFLYSFSGCNNVQEESAYDDALSKEKREIMNSPHPKELLNEFYSLYADIILHRTLKGSEAYSQKIDSLNYYWNQILINESNVRKYLLFEVNNNDSGAIYGEKFLRKTTIPRYPNNIHILFWLKALDEKDFLFGRRVRLGDDVYNYINHTTSIFPIFEKNNTTLPTMHFNDNFKKVRFATPEFIDYNFDGTNYSYLENIDSVVNLLKEKGFNDLKKIDLNWINYELNTIYNPSFISQNPSQLNDSVLGLKIEVK